MVSVFSTQGGYSGRNLVTEVSLPLSKVLRLEPSISVSTGEVGANQARPSSVDGVLRRPRSL